MVANTNNAYRQSGVRQRIRVVRAQLVNYEEAVAIGSCPDNPNETCKPYEIDLQRLRGTTDGYMDDVHSVRDEHGADIVHLVTNSKDACGVAYFMRNVTPDFERSAFALTQYRCEVGDYTFAHELGHNMGLDHDRYQKKCPTTACNGIIRNQPYSYSYGYVNQRAFDLGASTSRRWMTIMAYDTQCEAAGFPVLPSTGRRCFRRLFFSHPERQLNADRLGIPGSAASQDVAGPSDAVRTLNQTRGVVAAFR